MHKEYRSLNGLITPLTYIEVNILHVFLFQTADYFCLGEIKNKAKVTAEIISLNSSSLLVRRVSETDVDNIYF